MKIFAIQNPKKKIINKWHIFSHLEDNILYRPNSTVYYASCGSSYEYNPKHEDSIYTKFKIKPIIQEYTKDDEKLLCPSCVMQAWKSGIIMVVPVPEKDEFYNEDDY